MDEESIKKAIKETFESMGILPLKCPLEDLIKEGYLYKLGSKGMQICTGSGGALGYIKTCREAGLDDEFIASEIFVTEDNGLKSNTKWIRINTVNWIKNE